MSDVVDIGTGKPAPPGRCNACGEDIDRARLFEKGQQPGRKLHRDRVGNDCGPVLTTFVYRIVAWIEMPDGRPGRPNVFAIRRSRPIEGPGDEAVCAATIAAGYEARGDQGVALVGVKPEVEVLFAQLVNAE